LEQNFPINCGCINHACDRQLHEPECAKITLSLSGGRAGYIFGSETLGIGTEQHSADRHAGSLVIALRKSMERERLGVNSAQVLFAGLLGQAFGHALEQMMAAVCRKHHGLAAFGYDRSLFPLKCEMANHFTPLVARNYRDKLAAFDPFPVSAR